MKKEQPQIGDKVTCKLEQYAYYSNYGGNPVLIFKPGMIGVVVSIAPKVSKIKGSRFDNKDDFLVVDYIAPETNRIERVGLDYINVVVVKEENGVWVVA